MFDRLVKHWRSTLEAFIAMGVAAAVYWGFNFPAEFALAAGGFLETIFLLFAKDAPKE